MLIRKIWVPKNLQNLQLKDLGQKKLVRKIEVQKNLSPEKLKSKKS